MRTSPTPASSPPPLDIPALPLELIREILDNIYELDKSGRKPLSLFTSLSLVSPTFRDVAQERLFRSIAFHIDDQLEDSQYIHNLQARAMGIANSRRLLSYIRIFALSSIPQAARFPQGLPVDDPREMVVLAILAGGLRDMTSLEEVSISTMDLPYMLQESLIQVSTARDIKLHFDDVSFEYPHPPFPTRTSVIGLEWRQYMSFEDPSPSTFIDDLIQSSPRMRALSLSGPCAEVFEQLDIETPPRIRKLDIWLDGPNEEFIDILVRFLHLCPTIEDLTINDAIFNIAPGALPRLRSIRAPTRLLQVLVPGRPVTEVWEVFPDDSLTERLECIASLAQSTAKVTDLTLDSAHPTVHTPLLQAIAAHLPCIEKLHIFADPSFFEKAQTLVHHLTPLTGLTYLHFTLDCPSSEQASRIPTWLTNKRTQLTLFKGTLTLVRSQFPSLAQFSLGMEKDFAGIRVTGDEWVIKQGWKVLAIGKTKTDEDVTTRVKAGVRGAVSNVRRMLKTLSL